MSLPIIRGISVLICCYNSARRLPQTLQHLSAQLVPAYVNWEIIVIDNASTDDTAQVAEDVWAGFYKPHIPFRVLSEPLPGKVQAFQTGMNHSLFEFILTCDDDNWLCSNYVATAFTQIDSDDKIGVLGGYGILEPEQPAWPQVYRYRLSYVTGTQAAKENHFVYGAGSVCRKSALLSLARAGWAPITTGRTKGKLISGEDVEPCFALYLTGYQIIANDRLQFRHFVPLARQNEAYLLRLEYWISYSYILLNSYLMIMSNDQHTVQQKLNPWLTLKLKAMILLLLRSAKQLVTQRRWMDFDQQLQLRAYLGTIAGILQNKRKLVDHKRRIDELFQSRVSS